MQRIGVSHLSTKRCGEPHLFGVVVLHFHVEDTVVCDECLEAFVMVSGKPIYGEASEAGAYATQAVFVDERFLGHFVNGSEVVLHALAAIITADGFGRPRRLGATMI